MRMIYLVAGLALSGCASLAAESAARIGCDEDEITTSNSHFVSLGVENWNAMCKGKTYVCSRRGNVIMGGTAFNVACTARN